jgi:tryptophan synthase alpha chain
MTRVIGRVFHKLKEQGGKAFIPFVTAGDPDLETTIRLVPELERCGSHIVELGIPFSDPVADGPTIQRSSERALRHGYGLAEYLEAVKHIRRDTAIPLVLFSYFNPLFRYGLDALARDARSAGIDALLVTDMTPEEGDAYCSCLERHDLDAIFLVAPTSSPERIARICERCRGFVYVVSRAGVTGAREELSDTPATTVLRVRRQTDLPVAVGFGISHPSHVRSVWQIADGAVVGSAIVARIEKLGQSSDLVSQVGMFCRWLMETEDG